MKLITRLLDRLMPWRTMPSAYCLVCNKYRLKSEMVRWGLMSYTCSTEECVAEQESRLWGEDAW